MLELNLKFMTAEYLRDKKLFVKTFNNSIFVKN